MNETPSLDHWERYDYHEVEPREDVRYPQETQGRGGEGVAAV